MTTSLIAAFILIATSAFAQVRVEWSPEKPAFLEGEPIFIALRITNIGSSPIGYQESWMEPIFSIDGRSPYAWRQGCRGGVSGFAGGGFVSHPPTFAPGRTIAFKYLVRGYRLEPGGHVIRAKGSLPVDFNVPDRSYDTTVAVSVIATTQTALLDALDPLVGRARNNYSREGLLARAGVFAAAAPAHTDAIAGLAKYDAGSRNSRYPVSEGYEALADINSVGSRAHLRRLYDETPDLESRAAIVAALGSLSHADSLDFLVSLLPGRHTSYDDRIKRSAIDGLVCIGGEAAAAAVVEGTKGWMERDQRIELLMKVAPRIAVDELIRIDTGADFGAMISTCARLSSLTHYQWCDDDLIASVFNDPPDEKLVRPVFDKIEARWRSWWPRHRNIRMYGPDEPNPDSGRPKIW